MYLSILGKYSFLEVTFSVMPISDRQSLMHSKPQLPSTLHIQNPLAWYDCTTCCMDVMIIWDALSWMNSAVPKCLSL